MKRRFIRLALLGLAGAALYPAKVGRAQEQIPGRGAGRVYVILWFDTEDYILPQSDDAAKRIAVFLTQQGIRATFKVVGEKGRTLERRGRQDVIGALARHEIGYHSNTHSQHPTVAEYESLLGWEDGVEEFTRRERPGWEDLRRIFRQAPTCYGQPGNSWAPQPHAALRKWGVHIYLDEAPHVGLNGKPFWYGGILNIFNTTEGPQLRPNDGWSNLVDAKAKFQGFYTRMVNEPEGGIISLYFHPCEFIHREFWDAVNFARGANPPREQWKLPPVKSPEESEKAFKYFEDLVTYMKSFAGVEFVTASEAAKLFSDAARKHAFSMEELDTIAGQVGPEVSFQIREKYALSASEVLSLLTRFVVQTANRKPFEPVLLTGTPYGPGSPGVELTETDKIPWSQFFRAVLDVADILEKTQRVPNVVWMGSTPIPPESYLAALGPLARAFEEKSEPPPFVIVGPAHLACAKYVADDAPELWNWPIFPMGFHSVHLMGLAKLQAWTLKPALIGAAAQRH